MDTLRMSALVFLAMSILGGCASGGHDRNDASGHPGEDGLRFQRLTAGPAATDRASSGGVSLVDYDQDGDPDLFVTNGFDVSAETPAPQPRATAASCV